ncbi:hypothetical protein BJY04DRAFT_214487 [Aspergillus karnatakaensis]|uniref:uncharacterized protein n=1 Tax=Aspergillus karnatakaensis TaxID=1810916 RepID=UPI003CCD00CC
MTPTATPLSPASESPTKSPQDKPRIAAFEPFPLPSQQNTHDFNLPTSAPFPLALKPTAPIASIPEAITLIQQFASSGSFKSLSTHHAGAILIRGLPITTPTDYSLIAHALNLPAHTEIGRPPLRTTLAPNVKTANEGPPELPIWPHNEYGWSTIHPAWLTFCALKVPGTEGTGGGSTPITSSIYIAAELQRRIPGFWEELKRKGVQYTYRYTVEALVSNTGNSVLGAYGGAVEEGDGEEVVRRKVEREVRRHSERFEWHEDGGLSVSHVVPGAYALSPRLSIACCVGLTNTTSTAIRIHNPTNAPTFFGNITSAWGRSRHHGATRPPFLGDDGSYHPPPQFGDGTDMRVEDLDVLLDIAEQRAVKVQWEVGDLVILDNYAVQHSREPWVGERQVLAALWDDDEDVDGGEGRIGDFEEGKEILKGVPRERIVAGGQKE